VQILGIVGLAVGLPGSAEADTAAETVIAATNTKTTGYNDRISMKVLL
jgi:TRAP-type C4-dicarboxylate transport system permease large subunit